MMEDQDFLVVAVHAEIVFHSLMLFHPFAFLVSKAAEEEDVVIIVV